MMYTQVKQTLHLHIFSYILPTSLLGFEILDAGSFFALFLRFQQVKNTVSKMNGF